MISKAGLKLLSAFEIPLQSSLMITPFLEQKQCFVKRTGALVQNLTSPLNRMNDWELSCETPVMSAACQDFLVSASTLRLRWAPMHLQPGEHWSQGQPPSVQQCLWTHSHALVRKYWLVARACR